MCKCSISVDGPNENGETATEKASMNANDINEKASNNLIKSKYNLYNNYIESKIAVKCHEILIQGLISKRKHIY